MLSIEFTQTLPILSRLLRSGAGSIEFSPASGDPERAKFIAEVEALAARPEFSVEVGKLLFPSGAPTDVEFYNIPAHRFAGIITGSTRVSLLEVVWTELIISFDHESRQHVLAAVCSAQNRWFFEALGTFPAIIHKVSLAAAFAADWFVALRKCLANDMASGSFWATLGGYCESNTESALEVLESWVRAEFTDYTAELLAHMIGTLRSVVANSQLQARFERAEGAYEHSVRPAMRSIYFKSWVETAARVAVDESTLARLRAMAFAGTTEEVDAWYFVLSRLPLVNFARYEWALQMMESESTPDLFLPSKHHFVVAVGHLTRIGDIGSTDVATCRRIISKLLPLSSEAKGTWSLFLQILGQALRTDDSVNRAFVLKAAERTGSTWLEVLREPSLRQSATRIGAPQSLGPLVTSFLLHRQFAVRRLGLAFLSDRVEIALDQPRLDGASANEIEIIFRECQRDLMASEALGRLFGILWPRVQQIGGDFERDFLHEVGLQARSTLGFRTGIAAVATQSPDLTKTLNEAQAYFDALTKCRGSGALQIQIAGWETGRILYGRHFSREVSEKSKQYSLLSQLAREFQVLYAHRWTVVSDGNLGASSEMKEISVSSEIPRLEFLDEEGMLLRRLVASKRIEELQEGLES